MQALQPDMVCATATIDEIMLQAIKLSQPIDRKANFRDAPGDRLHSALQGLL
jgi:hypothetical protein